MKEVNFTRRVEHKFYARHCKITRNKNLLLMYNWTTRVTSTDKFKNNTISLTDFIITKKQNY